MDKYLNLEDLILIKYLRLITLLQLVIFNTYN